MTREEAMEELSILLNKYQDGYFGDALDMAIKALSEQRTGHWIKDDITERSKSEYKHKCDRCGAYHRAMYDYCPSCGAKMEEQA